MTHSRNDPSWSPPFLRDQFLVGLLGNRLAEDIATSQYKVSQYFCIPIPEDRHSSRIPPDMPTQPQVPGVFLFRFVLQHLLVLNLADTH